MDFTPINLSTWPRGQMFYYFSKMAPTCYSLTVQMDATKMHKAVHENGCSFFASYLWLVTKNLNRQTEFKVAYKEDVLGSFDTLTPLYAAFHEDDKTFSLMWTEYSESFPEFQQAYLNNQEKFGPNHGVLCQPQTLPPPNAYTVSCLPWVPFEHFSVQTDAGKPYFFPSVESGKIQKIDGRELLPLSLTCHHATTDGYHVKCFLENLQQDMDSFAQYLTGFSV